MQEKRELIKGEHLDVEWGNVTSILALGAYQQAEVLVEKYLLDHNWDDSVIFAKLAIIFRDEGMYRWAHGEEKSCKFNFFIVEELKAQSEVVISLVGRLSETVKIWFFTYFDEYFSQMMNVFTYRDIPFSFLQKYLAFIPFLPQTAARQGRVHIAPCISDAFSVEEKEAVDLYLASLLPKNTNSYGEETYFLGHRLLYLKKYKDALFYYHCAYFYMPKEKLGVLQEKILFASLGVRNNTEFLNCDIFSYDNEEYIKLLLLLKDDPSKLKDIVALADQNIKLQQERRSASAREAELEREKREQEAQAKKHRWLEKRKQKQEQHLQRLEERKIQKEEKKKQRLEHQNRKKEERMRKASEKKKNRRKRQQEKAKKKEQKQSEKLKRKQEKRRLQRENREYKIWKRQHKEPLPREKEREAKKRRLQQEGQTSQENTAIAVMLGVVVVLWLSMFAACIITLS